jgi:SAM-dependent methyltransferase
MGKSRILIANWYDYPQYYDIAVQTYTRREADFIQALCRKYCAFRVRRLLEPACGTGRLITEFAARGYDTIGFDLSQPALSYLRRRLGRRRLDAETFEADMADFRLRRPVDAAYCTVSTFRHLLTEKKARHHLDCVACSLRSGGIYVLGLHLLSSKIAKANVQCWTERRGETQVTANLRVLRSDRRRRVEKFQVCLLVLRRAKELRLRHKFVFRTYTGKQFRRLIRSVPSLELCDVYDFRYGIEQSTVLNDELPYSVFVLRRRLRS